MAMKKKGIGARLGLSAYPPPAAVCRRSGRAVSAQRRQVYCRACACPCSRSSLRRVGDAITWRMAAAKASASPTG